MNRIGAFFILLLAIAAYYVANIVTVPAMALLAGQTCANTGWFVHCRLPADTDASLIANLGLAGIALAVLAGLRLWGRKSSVYPFGMLVSGVTLFVTVLDSVLHRGILNHDRLVNDTMNALSIVILGSFIVITSIASARALPLLRLTAAVIFSFGAKVAGMVVFGLLQVSFRGPVELWLLYGIFMWMVFGLHLMAVSVALAEIDNRSTSTTAGVPA